MSSDEEYMCVKRDDGWYCRACGGYVTNATHPDPHEPIDCIIELRSLIDDLRMVTRGDVADAD